MKIAQILKQEISIALKNIGVNFSAQDLVIEYPADKSHGDFASNVAMNLFGKLKKEMGPDFQFNSPREFAQEIANKLTSQEIKEINKVEVAGPGFINFTLSNAFLLSKMGLIIQKHADVLDKFGKGKKYLIEHTSPNPNKAMHLGHLRNNVTGMAIANLLEAVGYEVTRDCVDNNRGIAIAKLMWGYLKFAHKQDKKVTDLNYWFEHQDEWQTPEDIGIRPDRFVDNLYVQAAEDFKNPDVEKIVRQFVVDWENKDVKNWALWEKVLSFSYMGQNMTLARLGNKWDKVWHEHEHYQKGKDLVLDGLKKGVFKKLDDGAVITDLSAKYNLSDTVVIKSDGTALYITQDLALTKLKKEIFNPDQLSWVIGPEQSLALKQMFAVCEQLGIVDYQDCHHIPYGYMSIKGKGKMSSREGNVVYIDDLLDEAYEKVANLVLENNKKLGGGGNKSHNQIFEKIGVGAVKYSILKVGRVQDMAFDFDESISFVGNSGPYIQYTFVRCLSVLNKAQNGSENYDSLNTIAKQFDTLLNNKAYLNFEINADEKDILLNLSRYSDIVEAAAADFAPHHVATYLYDLTSSFNTFYANHKIVPNAVEKMTAGVKTADTLLNFNSQTTLRLLLVAATAHTIKHGLSLLGIETVEKM
jgi:arginyl-tRNA synthetase